MVHDIQFSNCFVNYEKHFLLSICNIFTTFKIFTIYSTFYDHKETVIKYEQNCFLRVGELQKILQGRQENVFLGEGAATK